MHTIKKILSTSLIISFSASALATSPGFYLGVMGGPTSTDASEQFVATLANPAISTRATARSNL